MKTELLRTLLLEYLRANQRNPHLQFGDCRSGVEGLAIQRCPNELGQVMVGTLRLRDDDASRLKHVVWDLILERVLVPGHQNPNAMPDGWPFLSITDHGQNVLAATAPVPYDPDGYLNNLDKATGGLNASVQNILGGSDFHLSHRKPIGLGSHARCSFRNGVSSNYVRQLQVPLLTPMPALCSRIGLGRRRTWCSVFQRLCPG